MALWAMDGTDAFCDWLTVRQDHSEPHRPLHAAVESRFDRVSGALHERPVPVVVEARNGSSFQVVSDGRRVTWSGNPSRHGRWDSVRGLSVDEAKAFVNDSLRFLGLPEFSDGQVIGRTLADGSGNLLGSGAVVTRCDVTTNVGVGSSRDFLVARQRLSPCRLRPTLIEGNVYYGAFSRERTVRLYDKAADLEAKAVKAARKVSAAEGERVSALAAGLAAQGVVRVELEAKRALRRYVGGARWAALSSESMRGPYVREFGAMTEDILSSDVPDFCAVPREAAPWLSMYLHGVDLREWLPKSSFYRYRRALLPYGYDIAVVVAEPRFPRVQRFELKVPVLPADYEGPKAFDPELVSDGDRERSERRRRG